MKDLTILECDSPDRYPYRAITQLSFSLTHKGQGGLRICQTYFSSNHFRNLECRLLTSYTSREFQ
jgi:hypothetical protein